MSFERGPLSGADLEDLDLDAAFAYASRRAPALAERLPREELFMRLGLVAKAAPRLVPTPTGMLAFGHAPQLLHPEWGVSVITVAGLTLGDPLVAQEDLEGNIPSLVEQATRSVEKLARTVPDQVDPSGTANEYPAVAVREAVVNALVHRDLRRTGRVAIRLFVDRLEVWSPGGPPDFAGDLDEMTQEGGVSLPRNPLLAATVRHLGLGEQIGRGLPTMRRVMVGAPGGRVEVRSSAREVLVVLPSSLARPALSEQLS